MNKVFCMNSKCEHYIEDSCEEALQDKTAEIDENGKCALFKEGENEFYSDLAKMKQSESRKCSHCGKEMNVGYCIRGGEEYYCSDDCLHEHYSEQEYLDLYDNGNGDSYWTEWEAREDLK